MITLVIIGVIAAITVPTLINKTQNQEYVSKLKKTYSTLAQATNLIILEEGPVRSWATSTDNVYKLYKTKLINAKDCGENTGCFEKGPYKFLGNNNTASNWDARTDMRKIILSDGTQVVFAEVYDGCTESNVVENGSNDICALIPVDINGYKEPNRIGRDVFHFILKKDGLYPAGCDIDGLCNKSHLGYACACRILREGAMNY